MKLIQRGSNQTELWFDDGKEIFFSYNTPVAGFIPGIGYVRTEKKWSNTTNKHISAYLKENCAVSKPQPYFDMLAHG